MTKITRKVAARVLKVVDAGLVSGIGRPSPGQMCVEAAVCYAMGEPHGDSPSCVAPALRNLQIRLNDASWSSDVVRAKGLRRLAIAQLGSKSALDEQEFARRVVNHVLRVLIPVALRTVASVCKDAKHTAALITAAAKCETQGTEDAARDAKRAANAAAAAYAAVNAAATYAAEAAEAAEVAADYAEAEAYDAAAIYATNYAANAYAAAADAAAAYAADAADAAAAAARDKSLAEYAEVVVQILIEMNAPGCQWLDLAPLEAA